MSDQPHAQLANIRTTSWTSIASMPALSVVSAMAWAVDGYPWTTDSSGKLVNRYETDGIVEALNWHAKMVKAGYVHPDAVANNSKNAKQRFWSGKVAVCSDGTGAWNGDDHQSGSAAQES